MPVVLSGGNEFSRESDALNRAMLGLVKQPTPRILVVPTAASADNPRKAVKSGLGYLSSLNVRAEELMITDRHTSNDQALAATMETAHVIYLTDGNPLSVVEILSDSAALVKMRRAWSRGAILAAGGASGMALCDYYWDSGVWEKGLGLLKGIVVLPHYEYVVGRVTPDRLRQELPGGYTVLGLDDTTGVIVTGQNARVYGPEIVTVYSADSEQEYTEGGSFTLDASVDSDSTV